MVKQSHFPAGAMLRLMGADQPTAGSKLQQWAQCCLHPSALLLPAWAGCKVWKEGIPQLMPFPGSDRKQEQTLHVQTP